VLEALVSLFQLSVAQTETMAAEVAARMLLERAAMVALAVRVLLVQATHQ
jgi:hypothetical protein